MDTFELLNPRLTRRDFIKIAGAAAAMLGLSQALTPKMVRALESQAGKPAVIWLEGQDCAGCVESFLNNLEPLATDVLLNSISLRYNETAMAASGSVAEQALEETVAQGGYVLVIEGAIPLAEDGLYCTVGGRPFKDIVRECAKNAGVIIGVGACAAFGGIPRSGPTDAVGYLYRGSRLHHYYDDVGPKPVINLPTCPLQGERLVAVIIHYLTFGTVPELDQFQRPTAFYKYNQHENCTRRAHFEAGEFVTDFGNPDQYGWCLYLKGCKGPWAYQDCWKRLWNTRANYCIQAGIPCVACSDPEFYESVSPLYKRQFDTELPGIGRVDLDKIMATVGGVVAAGVGLDMVVSRAVGRWKSPKGEKPQNGENKE
jgi:hydrogenase small subunit